MCFIIIKNNIIFVSLKYSRIKDIIVITFFNRTLQKKNVMKYRIVKYFGEEGISSNITEVKGVIFASHEIKKL